MSRPPKPETISRELAALDDMDFVSLKERYVGLTGEEPPKRIRQKLLHLAVAYEIQARAGLPLIKRVRRRLDALSEGNLSRWDFSRRSSSLQPGGRLIREWHGKSYEVYVAEDGVYMDGKRYKSLSAAAHAITGARWNGPRFFGLRKTPSTKGAAG